MFESVDPNPPDKAVDTAARLFYVIAFLASVLTVASVVGGIRASGGIEWWSVTAHSVDAILAGIAGHGLEQRRTWGRTLAYASCAALLFSFPTGTVMGLIIFAFVFKADRAGLFARRSNDNQA